MKIFVVNLDRDTERLASIDAQLKAQGLVYERFSAIWAASLTRKERKRYFNHFRWWCIAGRTARNGEIGCAATHNLIYKEMVANNIPVACILEDDARLTGRLSEELSYLEEQVSANENKVFLLTNYTSYAQDCLGIVPSLQNQSTEAYVITLSGARSILSVNDPIVIACDNWQWFARRSGMAVCQVFPIACLHGDAQFGSYSDPPKPDRHEGCFKTVSRWVLHKGVRCVGKVLDWMLYKVGK